MSGDAFGVRGSDARVVAEAVLLGVGAEPEQVVDASHAPRKNVPAVDMGVTVT
jgi:hypothetical protein